MSYYNCMMEKKLTVKVCHLRFRMMFALLVTVLHQSSQVVHLQEKCQSWDKVLQFELTHIRSFKQLLGKISVKKNYISPQLAHQINNNQKDLDDYWLWSLKINFQIQSWDKVLQFELTHIRSFKQLLGKISVKKKVYFSSTCSSKK